MLSANGPDVPTLGAIDDKRVESLWAQIANIIAYMSGPLSANDERDEAVIWYDSLRTLQRVADRKAFVLDAVLDVLYEGLPAKDRERLSKEDVVLRVSNLRREADKVPRNKLDTHPPRA